MPENSKNLKVKIDTREQKPWKFPAGTETVRGKLDEGDYAIVGLEGKFGIERKTLEDIWASLTWGRERFKRELQRVKVKGYLSFIIIIEGSPRDFCDPEARGNRTKPNSLQATVRAWRRRYGIDFIFLKNSRKAACYARWWLTQRWREWNEELWHEQEPAPFKMTPWACKKRKLRMKGGKNGKRTSGVVNSTGYEQTQR